MKTILKPFIFIFLIVALSACSDDDDGEIGNGDCTSEAATTTSFFVANASGAYSGCLIGSGSGSLSERPLGGYLLSLIGNRQATASGQSFTLNLSIEFEDEPANPLPTGSYNIVSPDGNSQGSGNFDATITIEEEYANDVAGTIEILEVEALDSGNNRIGGTFSLTASDDGGTSVNLEGEFSTLLQR